MFIAVGSLIVAIVGLTVAYAAMSSTLTISGNATMKTASWNVAFDPTINSVVASGYNNNTAGIVCGTAKVDATTITNISAAFSKPGDTCTYKFKIKNTGTIDARLSSIITNPPSGIVCNGSNTNAMECGNITYKLTYDTATGGNLTVGDSLVKTSGEEIVILTISYTGEQLNSAEVVHSDASFVLTYEQI